MKHALAAVIGVCILALLPVLLIVGTAPSATGGGAVSVPITLPPITVTLPGQTATIKIPGPTVTAPGPTVRVPGPTVTVTRTVAPPAATTTINEPAATVTIRETVTARPEAPTTQTTTVTATPRQDATTPATIDPEPEENDVFFEIPDINLSAPEAVGLGTLAILILVGLLLLGMYAGYYLGYKDKEKTEAKFIRSLLGK